MTQHPGLAPTSREIALRTRSTPVPSTWSRRGVLVAGLAVTAVLAAACSGGSSSSGADPGSASAGSGRPQFNADFGAASGKITSISTVGAAVQGNTGTTTVAWASSTRFQRVAAVSLSSLARGYCVRVTSAGRFTPAATTVIAESVAVTSTSGCSQSGTGFPGGGTGTPRSGPPFGGGQPSPGQSGRPGGGFGGGRGLPGFGGAVGTISSVSGSTIVLDPAFGSSQVTVKTAPTTTFTTTSSATASAMRTGMCASAIGSKTSNGTIDARSITVSSPSDGKCRTTTFGGFRGGRGFFGGGQGSGNQSATNA